MNKIISNKRNNPKGLRYLRKALKEVLKTGPLERLKEIAPPKALISPLRTLFLAKEELIRWRSITAFGLCVAWIWEEDQEGARVIMRQLMWTLNDESGGIGWGSPEAMGESMAITRPLCEEYGRILLSYVWEDGNFLEYQILRNGALWGIARASQMHPGLIAHFGALRFMEPYTLDPDILTTGLSLLTLSNIGEKTLVRKIISKRSLEDATFCTYWDGDIKRIAFSSLLT